MAGQTTVLDIPTTQEAARERFQAVQRGDRSALAELAQTEESWMRGVVWNVVHNGHLTEDVVQQVWLTVAKKASQCKDPRCWRAWLYQTARHAALDAIAENRKWNGADVEAESGPAVMSAAGQVELAENHRRVLAAVQSLPLIYREPLVLRAMQGWDYEQIAETLGLPVATVETRLVRARRLLRELLGESYES